MSNMVNTGKWGKIACIAVIMCLLLPFGAFSQGEKKVIQLSGLVVAGDSLYGVPGVIIFVSKTGRGTNTNFVGYFSLPVLSKDSVIIRALGYKEKHFIVPDSITDKMSTVIQLSYDTLMLPAVEIFPWPTERVFKEAFLSLKLPEEDLNNMNKNLNEQVMKRMLYKMEDDGSMNHRYYMQKQIQKTETRFMAPTISLLNPFAWASFIQSVKRGDLKKKDDDYEDE